MELIANIMKNVARNPAVPCSRELLSLLLNDAANLSQFIRYSGLSQEMQAAVLLEAASLTTNARRLFPRAMGEFGEMLSGVRPTTAGIDATYGAAVSLGEPGSESKRYQSAMRETDDAKIDLSNSKTGEMPFKPFSPDQSDFDKTIDNIGLNSESSKLEEMSFALINGPPLNAGRGGEENAGPALWVVLASLVGMLLFGFFALLN